MAKAEKAASQSKYRKAFEDHLRQVDGVALIVLKGHLIIESALDNIIGTFFFHAEHLLGRRLQFHHKMAICRALSLRKDKERTWDLIEAITVVRNEIAHHLAGEKLKGKLDTVRRLYVEEGYEKLDGKRLDDELMLANACAGCVGFLSELEKDLTALREHINTLDTVLRGMEELDASGE